MYLRNRLLENITKERRFNVNQLQIIEFNNQRILTTQQIAEAYETESQIITNNFTRNKERYQEGKHYFLLEKEALKAFKSATNQIDVSPNINKLYLWTEKGAFLHAKSLNTDKAWEVYDQLVDSYFNSQAKQLPTNYKEAVEHLLVQIEENEKLQLAVSRSEQIIGELKPKADYVDLILKSRSLLTTTQIAKDYGMSGTAMNRLLHELGVQYKQSDQWLLYSKHHGCGYTHSETIDITRKDGRPDVTLHTKWTQKGRLFIYELLKTKEIVPVIER